MNTNPKEPADFDDFETVCAHYGEDRAGQGGAAAPALYQTSTFVFPDMAAFDVRKRPDAAQHEYTRISNPTTQMLLSKLTLLERGEWAFGYGSGMGAVSAALTACTRSGDHLVVIAQCYGPTRWYLERVLSRYGVTATFVNSVRPEDFVAAMRPETRILYLESPTTGLFEVPDVAAVVSAARREGVTIMFDNSWATPRFFRPIESGCDLVIHSATKYVGGHSDVVAGIVVGRGKQLRESVADASELLGATLDPFAGLLLLRGLRTLSVRMKQHHESGLAIAHFLESHPKVLRVHHPGLESHPQYDIARRQFDGCSGLFSFVLKDDSDAAARRFIDRLRLFSIGVSWGGFESLVVGGRFFSIGRDKPEWVIRFSVGLESTEDLIADIKNALEG
jgi:cystathionine beta-lyase